MGRLAHTKVLRAAEVGNTRERILDEQRGRWEILCTEHHSGPIAEVNGEVWVDDVSGTLGEPL